MCVKEALIQSAFDGKGNFRSDGLAKIDGAAGLLPVFLQARLGSWKPEGFQVPKGLNLTNHRLGKFTAERHVVSGC